MRSFPNTAASVPLALSFLLECCENHPRAGASPSWIEVLDAGHGSGLLDLTGDVGTTDSTARLERTAAVAKILETDHVEDRATLVRALILRVTVHADRITVTINLGAVWGAAEPIVERDLPVRLRRCGMAMRLVVEASGGVDRAVPRGPDPHLVGLLSRAHEWFDQLKSGRAASVQAIATAAGMRGDQATRIVHLAFLAPDLTEQILRGDHMAQLTATRLLGLVPLPTDWATQPTRPAKSRARIRPLRKTGCTRLVRPSFLETENV
jgi:hypothetical protein